MSVWWTVERDGGGFIQKDDVLSNSATRAAEEAVKTWLSEVSFTRGDTEGVVDVRVARLGEHGDPGNRGPWVKLRVKAKLEWHTTAEART